jgi:hypothetical protein
LAGGLGKDRSPLSDEGALDGKVASSFKTARCLTAYIRGVAENRDPPRIGRYAGVIADDRTSPCDAASLPAAAAAILDRRPVLGAGANAQPLTSNANLILVYGLSTAPRAALFERSGRTIALLGAQVEIIIRKIIATRKIIAGEYVWLDGFIEGAVVQGQEGTAGTDAARDEALKENAVWLNYRVPRPQRGTAAEG